MQSIVRQRTRLSPAILQVIHDRSKAVNAIVIFALTLLIPFVQIFAVNFRFQMRSSDNAIGNFKTDIFNQWGSITFDLDKFSQFPNDFVIASTEVGHPGILNSRKVIVDLAGLNTADFAHPPFSTELLFRKYRPDLIYMPHPDYREMIAQIKSDTYFGEHYEYFDGEARGALLDIAIWKDSKYYPMMQQIMRAEPALAK